MSNSSALAKLNLNHLVVFCAIAEHNSLTAAAKALDHEKSRISRILNQLENDLQTKLVYRTTRDLRLTHAGQLFYRRCKKNLMDLEAATHQVMHEGDIVQGHISLTAAHGVCSALLPRVLNEFHTVYPQVTFEIMLTQYNLNLAKEGVDVALRMGRLKDSSYRVKKIADTSFVFAAAPKFLNRATQPIDVEHLTQLPVLTLPKFTNKKLVLTKSKERTGLQLKSLIACNSPDLVLDLTLGGLGIGLLPEFICRHHLKTGQLVQVMENWQTAPVALSVLFHPFHRQKTHVSTFIAFLAHRLPQILAAEGQ